MSKINKILLIVIIILVIAIIVAGVLWFMRGSGDDYYAVYLDTGDLYFGTLSRFPHLSLTDVWYLQRDSQNQGLSLQDFSKVAWGPENKIELNQDKIVWMAKISDASQLMPVLTGRQVPLSQPQQNNGIPSGGATSTPSK